jgi:uncharacterized protein (TIGR03086 family)
MPPPTDRSGVELLERALSYTRGALQHVRPTDLTRPTPCAGWDLDRLLDHMDDALDAFTDGASGVIDVDPPRAALEVRVTTLQTKACALLGAWSAPWNPSVVHVGGAPVPTAVLTRAASLEITVHGWDVAETTGRSGPMPAALARDLMAVALDLVDDGDRGTRFAAPLVDRSDDPVERLLAFLGRRHLTGPREHVSGIRRTQERPAS